MDYRGRPDHGGRRTIPMTNTNASASASTSTSAGNNPSLQQPFHQFRPSAPRPMHTGASTNTTTNPKDWPQAVRQYVERCFKTAKPSQRPNLQQALRLIIQDAQVNGQLYSRPWSSLPPPDLSLRPDQAASVVISVAGGGVGGVGGVCGAGGAAGVGGGAGGRASRFDVGPPGAGQGYGQGYGHGDPGPGGVHGGTYGGSYGQPPSGLQPPPGLYHQHPMHQQYVHHQQPPVAYTPVNPPPIQKPSMVSSSKKRTLGDLYRPDVGYQVQPPQQPQPEPPGQKSQKAQKRKQKKSKSSSNTPAHSQGGSYADDEHARRMERAGRFKDDGALAAGAKKNTAKRDDHRRKMLDKLTIDWDKFAIAGTCKSLEKAYFRLTSAPDPSTVRPAPVLRKALARLVDLISSGDVNYFYSQDQFKGMRQDCVVQALKGDLPIAIYEAHARAALEYGDMAEYNQCQSQLRGLYSAKTRKPEFIAYRVLYQSVFSFLNKNKGEIVVGLLESLDDAEGVSGDVHVQHALDVRKALVSCNFAAFFRLYDSAPALGRALMDLAVPKLRFECLVAFSRAFMRLDVGDFLCSVLGFLSSPADAPEAKKASFYEPGCSRYSTGEFEGGFRGVQDREEALEECMEFLEACGVVMLPSTKGDDDDETPVIDCRATASSLKMPEEKDQVAHGDATLALADFMKNL